MSQKQLRTYQQSAIDSLFDWLFTKKGHPLVVAPVGAGKSLLIAETIKKAHEISPRTRIVVLTHVKELLVQIAEEIRGQYPDADFGFYCASLNEKKLHNDVTLASIQSVYNKINYFNRPPEIIIIDEAHLISHNDQTQYRKFIDAVLERNPNAKVCGFTGTPFRSDTGRLEEGEGALFDGIAYQIGIKWMIDQGYLCRPVTPKVDTKLSAEGVKTRNGDYIAGQLEKAVDIDAMTKACVKEMIEQAYARKKWLIFSAGIQHCEHIRDALRLAGVSTEMVIGDMPQEERDAIIKRYKNNEFKALVNVAVLTTGFNVPEIDMLAFMRPTRSPVLYIQCIGRGLRTAPNKDDCLVLDFGGVIDELGTIDALDIRKKGYIEKEEGGGEAILKRCPACGAECAAAQRYCYVCSYNFISEGLVSIPETKSILEEELIEEHIVIGMKTKYHRKSPDKPATLQVSYATMSGEFNEWVCFDHAGYAREKAVKWHMNRSEQTPPNSVNEAIEIQYPTPSRIKVKKEGKYWRVLSSFLTKNMTI